MENLCTTSKESNGLPCFRYGALQLVIHTIDPLGEGNFFIISFLCQKRVIFHLVFFNQRSELKKTAKGVILQHLLLPLSLFLYISSISVNSLNPNISMHILHTVLYSFHKMLTRRMCFTIKSFVSFTLVILMFDSGVLW